MNTRRYRRLALALLPLCGCWLWPAVAAGGSTDVLATQILTRAGIRVGVCELPRVGDGSLAVALARAGATLVHGLAPDDGAAAGARAAAAGAGMLGTRVMVEQGSPAAVPLADWVADLVVIADATDANLAALPPGELRRIASPARGVIVAGQPAGGTGVLTRAALEAWAAQAGGAVTTFEDAGGLWVFMRVPALAGADEWTHFQYSAGNNPVSADTVIQPPYSIQYMTPPFFGAGGGARMAGGRLFEMQGQQYRHSDCTELVKTIWCRNAYNGQILWQMPLPRHVDAKRANIAATADTFYLPDNDQPGVRLIDAETGVLRGTVTLGGTNEEIKWLAVENGRLFALIGALAPPYPNNATYVINAYNAEIRGGKLNHGTRVCAYDLAAQTALWQYTVATNELIDPRAVAVWSNRVAFLLEDQRSYALTNNNELVEGRRLMCLDAGSGAEQWQNNDARLNRLWRKYLYIFGREYHPCLIGTPEGVRLRLLGIYGNDIFMLDPNTGTTRWALISGTDFVPETFAGFISGGKYYAKNRVYDVVSGAAQTTSGQWDGGCGVRTWSPHTGILGNLNEESIGLLLKSDCHMGTFAAGGLVNVLRGWCGCTKFWRGSFAFAPRGTLDVHRTITALAPGQLQPGPANPDAAGLPALSALDWPVYRHDNERTAGTPATVPPNATLLWTYVPPVPHVYSTNYDKYVMQRQDQPTEPVAAGGLVFFGGSDGKVEALDAATGARIWTYWTGGSVYAPPTVSSGMVYVGSYDGQVYCLDAQTGALAWRFRAAPFEQRIMRGMHLVSRWPVMSGVLVYSNTAYFAAGQASIQGVHVYAVDARTGALRWHNGQAGKPAADDLHPSLTPDGFMTVMGSRLYLRTRADLVARFNLATGALDPLPDYPRTPNEMDWDFYAPFGREIAVLGNGLILEGGRNLQHELNQREGDRNFTSFFIRRFSPDGQVHHRAAIRLTQLSIIAPAFDADGMAVVPGGYTKGPLPTGTQGLQMLDMRKVKSLAQAALDKGKGFASMTEPLQNMMLNGEPKPASRWDWPTNAPALFRGLAAFRWEFGNPMVQINALALTTNAVVITRGIQKTSGSNLIDDYSAWTVMALARGSGAVLWEYTLPCEPMLNGLCIDRAGRVIATLRNGGAVCVGAP
jgi:outer membrane protein assembly factor BamB